MRILIIEDNADICALLQAHLPPHGFAVDIVNDAQSGIASAQTNSYNLILLDLHLPDRNGDQIIQDLQTQPGSPPILMLTVLDDAPTKARIINAGADDYLVKPFHLEELVARMRALTRRRQVNGAKMLCIADVELDTVGRVATRSGVRLPLTPKELALLECFMLHPEAVVTKGVLVEYVWSDHADPFSNSVDTHLTNLRKKLGQPPLIHTVHGQGYRMGMQK
jgi:DNA-binding response OmpR family regulator